MSIMIKIDEEAYYENDFIGSLKPETYLYLINSFD